MNSAAKKVEGFLQKRAHRHTVRRIKRCALHLNQIAEAYEAVGI